VKNLFVSERMAEFSIVAQRLDAQHPVHGQVSEELRTLQVKRSISAVARMQERAKGEKFGKAKGAAGGGVNVVKEDILIEAPTGLWGAEEEDIVAHRLVGAAGKVNITLDKREGANTPTPSHSRRNSGTITPGPPISEDSAREESRPPRTRSRSGSPGGGDDSLPTAPSAAQILAQYAQ
jgi:hypothetical protein